MPDILDSLPATVQWSLRMRVPLYRRLRKLSDDEGDSMNAIAARAIEEYLDRLGAK
jgi:predicted DNA-binding protein